VSAPLQRIKPWQALGAMALVGVAIALFLVYRGMGPDTPDRFADPERQGIYESGLDSCIVRAQTEVAGSQTGVTGDQIEAYCDCAMGGVVEKLTDAEIERFNDNAEFSEETMAMMEAIAGACSQQFLQN
jgi:hypothetical protein